MWIELVVAALSLTLFFTMLFGKPKIAEKEAEQQKIIKLLCEASPECKKEMEK